MANIRVKDLATTATATSSDDYFAIDGTSSNTRKISAYTPVFGGGATVNGLLGLQKDGAYTSTIEGAQTEFSTGNSFLFKNSGATTLLTLAYNGTATFAGAIAVSTGSINLPAGGITMDLGVTVGASARITWLGSTELSSANGTLTVQNSANTAGFILNGTTDDTLMLRKRSNGNQAAALTAGAGTFSGAVAIGNSAASAVAAASTHKVSILIGGVQYYLLASNV